MPDGRRRDHVIDRLLVRPEFYDFWALKFADIFRSNGRLIQTKGAYAFHRWIRESLERNVPMDQFVRALLTSEGSTFRNPAANYYRISRDPETAVETTAQLFLGRANPVRQVPQSPVRALDSGRLLRVCRLLLADRPEEGQPARRGSGLRHRLGRRPPAAHRQDDEAQGPGRTGARRPEGPGSAGSLAAWLSSPDNPFFAKSLVNRIWFHLIGRGIVEPVDDFRDSNPACNDELLDGLTADFVKNGYDLKRLIRSILHSRTYQLSATTNPLNADDTLYFSHAQTKLLPAEVLLDAISSVTGTTTAFNGLPNGARATQIPDGTIDNPFLKTFGRPARELACECERESESNLSQALQLIGGATVNGKLRDDAGRMATLAKSGKSPEQITRELYLVALSREPSASEVAAASKHLSAAKDRRQAHRRPGLGPDQLQRVPVPPLSRAAESTLAIAGDRDRSTSNIRSRANPETVVAGSVEASRSRSGPPTPLTIHSAGSDSWAFASPRSTHSPSALSPATPRRSACSPSRPTSNGCRTWRPR